MALEIHLGGTADAAVKDLMGDDPVVGNRAVDVLADRCARDPAPLLPLLETTSRQPVHRLSRLFARIGELGDGSMLEGVLHGVESGWFVQEIAEAAFEEQRRFERGDLIQVGVNAFAGSNDQALPIHTEITAPH